MRQHKGFETPSSLRSQHSGTTGIIYLAWHGKAKERPYIRQVLASSWRDFAEHAIAQHNREHLLSITAVWLRDDLYLYLPNSCWSSAVFSKGSGESASWKVPFMVKKWN